VFRTKQSIDRCSLKLAACYVKNLKSTYGPSECAAMPGPNGRLQAAFPVASQFALGQRRSKIAHCLGIGKAIISGANQNAIATIVDRSIQRALQDRGKKGRNRESSPCLADAPASCSTKESLTWDGGVELSVHRDFSIATNMVFYFCDLGSPWQRGTNENTDGLLRQYFAKRTGLASYTQCELDAVAAKLNSRPRKTLGFKTPAEALDAMLH